METEHGSKFDIQVLLLSHPHSDYLLLRRKERDLPGELTVTFVRVTIMDLFANEVEDFQKDWYQLTWTISCREDGNIWVEA